MHKVGIVSIALFGLALALNLGCNGPGRWTSNSLTGALPVPQSPIALAGRDAQGNLINLENYRGHVVLIDVWKTG